MFETILITAGVLGVVGWLLKKAFQWILSKIVLPAQLRGYSLALKSKISFDQDKKPILNPNQIYFSKEGDYTIFSPYGEPYVGFLLDLSDVPDLLTKEEIKTLKAKLQKVEKNLSDPTLTDLVLKITVARNQTPQARGKNVKIANEFFVKTKKAQLSTIELKPKTGKSDRYIICYCPNAVTYRQMIDSYQALADSNQATVVCFDYPNVGNSKGACSSQSDLIEAGMKQVQRLFVKGVPADKITLYGHSLGGAIATIVAARCHQQKRPVSVINDRSFSSVGDVPASFINNPRLKRIVKRIAGPFARLLNWDLNAALAYQSIPSQNKMLIVYKRDEIINYEEASVYKKEKAKVTEKTNVDADRKTLFHIYKKENSVYKMKESPEYNFQHGVPINAMKDTQETPMLNNIRKFIAKQ